MTSGGWRFQTIVLALVVLVAADPAAAQRVRGRVVEEPSGRGVAAVALTLVDSVNAAVAAVLSDAAGRFSLDAPGPGTYRLRAERLGYATVTSASLALRRHDVIEIELRLTTEAVPLEPLRVVSQRDRRLLDAGFYERMREYGRDGLWAGEFFDSEQIERFNAPTVTALFRRARGIWTFPEGPRGRQTRIRLPGGCSPLIYLNGILLRDQDIEDLVTPTMIVGVEVYYGTPLPLQYNEGVNGCAIAVWTG